MLRTADSVSPVATEAVAASLVAFVVVYFAVFGAGAFYMLRLMREPPKPAEPELPANEPMRAQGIMPGPVLASPLPHAAGEVGHPGRVRTNERRPRTGLGRRDRARRDRVRDPRRLDLGVGILFPLLPEEAHRDQMMNSVAPVWDGNETWLCWAAAGSSRSFRSPTRS